MPRALVVEREALVGGAEREAAGRQLDPAGAASRLSCGAAARGRAPAGKAAEKQRLAHRLVVLRLVADDHLEQRPVARSDPVEDLQRALAHRLEVVEDVLAAQERDVAAHGARGLEGVVEVGEVAAQQRLAAVAVHEPQVLVGGDVAEIPVQRAHERVLDALELGMAEGRDEREGPCAHLAEGLAERRGCNGRHAAVRLPSRTHVGIMNRASWRGAVRYAAVSR